MKKAFLIPIIIVIVAIAGIIGTLHFYQYLSELTSTLMLGLFSSFMGSGIALLFFAAYEKK